MVRELLLRMSEIVLKILCYAFVLVGAALLFGLIYVEEDITPLQMIELREQGISHLPQEKSTSEKLMLGTMSVVLVIAGVVFAYGSHKIHQFGKDREATRLYALMKSRKAGAFYLFLRPFAITNKVDQPKSGFILDPSTYTTSLSYDLESVLYAAVRNSGLLIALGLPGETIGAARLLTTEYSWREEIVFLISKAKAVFCVPLAYEGTIWEIRWLKANRMLSKTLFVMPPRVRKIDLAAEWARAQAILRKEGIQLPSYRNEGALFRVKSDGSLLSMADIHFRSSRLTWRSTRRLIELDEGHHAQTAG